MTRWSASSYVLASVFVLALGALAVVPAAEAASGTVHGRVIDPAGGAVSSIAVELHNDITGFRSEVVTGTDGSFRFFNVPFNPYEIHVEAQGFRPVRRTLELRSAMSPELTIALELAAVHESVVVEQAAGALEADSSTSHVDIDKSYVQRAPATLASRALEELITATPGFAKDENGRYHFQGFHSQGMFVIDGQTISDQTGMTFSNSIDPGIAQGIEVIYGNVPAEYGEKIGTVVNLTTRSGLSSPFHGELYGGGARFATYEGGFALGGGSRRLGAYASANASWSDRFLDPVNFDNLHNQGNTQRAFVRLDYASPDLSDLVRLTALLGQTHRDVPNTYSQQAAGQDQQVHSQDQNLSLGWTHVFSSKVTIESTAFARLSRFELLPSTNDTPVEALSERRLDNYGVNTALTWMPNAHHELKLGGVLKLFPIDEHFAFGLTDPQLNDPAGTDY